MLKGIDCLIPKIANRFILGLKSGEINPDKLTSMNSEQRREFLAKYVGAENAKWVNTDFESKLLLKNQKQGMITWAKKVGGLKEKARRDIISKIEKLDKALSPKEENAFLSDIVERRLGVQITSEEASKIVDLTNKLKSAEKGTKEYGKYKQELVSFMRENAPPQKLAPVSNVLSVLRSIKTGFDLSAALRQGWAYFGTKQWGNAFKNMFGYLRSQSAIDELEADMYSSRYADQLMTVKRDLGLTLLGETFTQREEEFASTLIDKIPLLRGSARAYEGFLSDLRFHRFVDVLGNMEKAGNDISGNKEAMKDLAKVIAAASGRGSLGSAEGAANAFATVMFSPRWVASRIQVLTNPALKRGQAQKEAATALARMIGISVSLLGLAAMMGADVEKDPRSANFGKIKIGNTRYDMTGGMSQYIVLMTRLIRGSTKSSVTGKVTKLNTGDFGQRDKFDLLTDFLSNKTSPIASAIRDILKGQTYEGEKINLDQPPKKLLMTFADQMITPLIISETVEAYQNAADNKIATGITAGIASIFGVSVGSYQFKPYGKKWERIKEERGEEVYNKYVARARDRFNEQLLLLEKRDSFINAPETGKGSKAEQIDKMKKKVTKAVLEYYNPTK